ncbi:MAG: malto-oligosyltrehalose trehalohydrolase [Acetobacteraceae bacterium]|nr:malto-oligosyltrehalose trehalohydrolase [Acetobacteraceae bacterium]
MQFSLWAPRPESVSVAFPDRPALPMTRATDGWFTVTSACDAGTAYAFRLDDGKDVPDPASRRQKDGIHGWSVVVDATRYAWRDTGWSGRPWREAVIYELHAGILGGFKALIGRLPDLAALGVTAIEVMPVNAFPGERNWGYDGVLPYAPDAAYGTPDDFRGLVDAAHALGMMVFLDVVYNHFGPDGNYLSLYAPDFFRSDVKTPWGAAIDFRRPEVRSFFTDNVLMWLTDYHLDGLRFDAVHAITESDWIDEMAAAVRRSFPPDRHIHLILENHNEASHLERNVDAQWNDDLHNVLHVILTGENAGYYADYSERTGETLLRCLTEGWSYQGEFSRFLDSPRGTPSVHLPPSAHVMFLQNHDQTGNRAFGERLTVLTPPAALDAVVALQLLCPQIPLLFMGEEIASRTPFLFFTDHSDELAEAVREGRRAEFAGFAEFASPEGREQIPDPNALATFLASMPRPGGAEADARLALYKKLISIRRCEIVPRLDATRTLGGAALGPKAVAARWQLGDGSRLSVACNLDAAPVTVPQAAGRPIFCSKELEGDVLPAFCTAAYLDDAT